MFIARKEALTYRNTSYKSQIVCIIVTGMPNSENKSGIWGK